MAPISFLHSLRIRRFRYIKFTLFLVLIFKFEFQKQVNVHQQKFERDLQFCRICFEHQKSNCEDFFESVTRDSPPSLLHRIINFLPIETKLDAHFLKFKNQNDKTKIISKSISNADFTTLKNSGNLNNIPILKTRFLDLENLDKLQFCSVSGEQRFLDFLQQQTHHNEHSILLHLISNVEPMLMPLMESHNFPVPKNYATCGFTLYQQYAGKALEYFFGANFDVKLKISVQLLESAIKFSEGIDGFRIYVTDLNADNVVYDEKTQRISYVDLDTVLIVDTIGIKSPKMYRHVFIECVGCFAYSQMDLCKHKISDVNIFAVCQFLREDLNGYRGGGFLYPIPPNIGLKFTELNGLLDKCVDCTGVDCLDRFEVAEELILLFDFIANKIRADNDFNI